MRAICESCAKPQPVDWRPGNLCTDCGLAVREESRCYWCAKWAPKGKFCRKCGAGSVSHEQYGPARMLKQMGASVFEIPKLLVELDPDLIATHQSLYGAHAALANRHVEDARWLGQFLYQKHWGDELEEELIPQLPWTDAQTKAYQAAPVTPVADWQRAKAISELSPFPRVRDLAHLVRVHLGDFSDLRLSAHLIRSDDEALAGEAALQLSGWRAVYAVYTEISRHDLIAVLKRSPLEEHAAPRLAVLGAEPRPVYALTGNTDTDFLVHILDQNVRALEEMLDAADPMRRYVAAAQLIRFHQADRVGPTLLAAQPEWQLQLLQDVNRYKKAIPALHPAFFALVETATEARIVKSASAAINLAHNQADALRLLEMTNGASDILHTILYSKPHPETLYEVGSRVVASGKFNMNQWGWDDAAKPNAMPLSFVEDRYSHASPKVQEELLRFAEKQIEAHGEPRTNLERLVIRACFSNAPVEVLAAAWASIHRIQMHRQVGLTVPCDLSLDNVEWCWNMPEVLEAIARLMANPKAVQQTFVRDDFSRFLRSAEDDFFAAAARFPNECQRVILAAPLCDPYTYAAQFAKTLEKALHPSGD